MNTEKTTLTPAVVVIGGGPSGLRAARELAPKLGGDILVLDRETTAGGIPRHSNHPGYGLRDLGRIMSGPAYARRLVDQAVSAGAQIRTSATVTGWHGGNGLDVTTPQGRLVVDAKAIILATGARERPRAARLVPGDRPSGIYTTGQLQNHVYLHGHKVGKRAVIIGAELVSWSAALTLSHVGCKTVALTTEYSHSDSYAAFSIPGRAAFHTKVLTRAKVTKIIGKPHIRAVEMENLDTGSRTTIECDTLVFTGDWIPDHELARSAGIEIDTGTRGPVVDTALRTDRPGVFAIGNLLHPVDTADVAALDGAHVAQHVLAHLQGKQVPSKHVRILADAPFRWVSPGIMRQGDPAPARHRLLLWSNAYVRAPRITVRQGGRTLAEKRLAWPAAPGRVFRIPSSLLAGVRPDDGSVRIGIHQ